MSEILRVRQEDRVLRMTLNRPEKRNALNIALCRELLSTVHQASPDPGVGCFLLDAEGPVFCAGMDLHEVLDASPDDLVPLQQALFNLGATLRKPLVAAVHGAAIAGGLGLALTSHILLAADDATFGLTEIRIGLWPYLIFPSIAAAAGTRRATELALTGRIFDAAEALRLGLAEQVVPRAELAERAAEIARKLGGASAQAVSDGLGFVELLHAAPDLAETVMNHRRRAQRSRDFEEGVRAFREKRTPRWPSHV
ncbi:MAG: enoyl-CoA hydratase/isomerase family protein [Bryobacterales bacterium]|nr:enoyl-CoA hydratase/isomerase family protein [Bryobacterales bacterium]